MRLPLAVTLLSLAACSRTAEGPTPVLSEATNPRQPAARPARVCNAQAAPNGWQLTLSGSGFALMPQDVLTDSPRLGLPTVQLEGPTPTTLARESVFYVGSSQLTLQVPTRDSTPALELAPGTYALIVTNPHGASGRLDQALQVVPPPTLTRVLAPEGFSESAPSPLVLEGTGFRAGEVPSVVLRAAGLPEVTLSDVTVNSASELEASLPAGTAAGTYDVVVTNPEGCSFTLPQGLTVNYVRLGTLTLDPRFGWQRRNQPVTLYNAPTGDQRSFAGGAPEIFLLAPLKSDPSRTVEIPLRRAAYVSPTVVTAVVPTCSGNAALPLTDAQCPNGIAPGGPYALKVRDSNGATGQVPASNGFTVLTDPPPSITSIAPSAIDTNGLTTAGNPLVVTGIDFGTGAKVQLLTQLTGGRIRACDLPSTGTPTATELRALVPRTIAAAQCVEYTSTGTQEPASVGFTLDPGLYVVRVQNTANPAYANYSGLIVTNPAANPVHGPGISTRLTAPRADFPLLLATDDLGQPYLYALGGSDGTNTLASVEVAPVTLFGDLGGVCSGSTCTFRTLERTPLPESRRGLSAVVRTVPNDTSYLFVLGGVRADGTTVKTVSRAQVLKSVDAPALAPPEPATGGSLPAGTFYYRVSALLRNDHPANPGGETLPSDEYPVTVDSAGNGAFTLRWPCMADAVRYRIYRTAAPNAPSGSGLLLDEVTAAATCTGSPLPLEAYTDNGSKTPAGDAPLPNGALGKWVAVGNMTGERANAAARLVGDALYVAGGFCGTAGPDCPAANATLNSVERATFTASSAALGAFSNVGTLGRARRRFSLAVADANSAPNSFTSATPDNSRDVWLLAVGGDQGGAPLSGAGTVEVSQVADANGPRTTLTFANAAYNSTGSTHGGWAEVIANYLFLAGATGGTGFTFRSNFACPGGGNDVGKCTGAASFSGTLNNTSIGSYQQGGPRYLAGTTLFRAFIYAAGGFPNDAGGTPTATLERIIY